MGESSGSSVRVTLAIETQLSPTSYLSRACIDPSGISMEQAGHVISTEEIIEKSKSHWSQLGDFDSDNEVAEVSNMELFKTLQVHPTWDSFFLTFGKGEGSRGELVMGEKFAEGGQAKIYNVKIKWNAPKLCIDIFKRHPKFCLKVFKKGTFLQHLQLQWPQGMLRFHANRMNRLELGLSSGVRLHCSASL